MWRLFRRRRKDKEESGKTPLLEEKTDGADPVSGQETKKSAIFDAAAEEEEVKPAEYVEVSGSRGKSAMGDPSSETSAEAEAPAETKPENHPLDAASQDEPGVRTVEIDADAIIRRVNAEDKEEKTLSKAKQDTKDSAGDQKPESEQQSERSLYEWTLGKKKKGQKKSSAGKHAVQVGNLKIGKGEPKICVPVTGVTAEEVIRQTEEAVKAHPDMIEWRADYFEQIRDRGVADTLVEKLATCVGDIPILFTYRNKREGGTADLFADEYQSVVRWAAGRREIALVDVEGLHPEVDTEILVAEVHQLGKPVVASAHYFVRMPKKPEMEWTLDRLEKTGADILKLAVMPSKPKDVLKLMEVTEEKNRESSCPLITMAMGDLGKVSRVSGKLTGSAVTFGTVGAESAPGQMPVEELRRIMEAL